VPAPSRAAFRFVFATVALDMLALGVMVPVLPKLIVQLADGDVSAGARWSGWFGFSWALMQFLFSPVLGSLSDRLGRRPVILASNLGLGLDYIVMALAPSLPWLLAGRVLSGITSASYATAGAYIADVTPPEQRAARFGALGAAFGLGFVIGPAVGGALGTIDLRTPFYAAAALSFANFAYGVFVLPESLPAEKRSAFHLRAAHPLGALAVLRAHPQVLALAAAATLYNLAHEALPSVFVLYTDFRYHWSEGRVGAVLAGVGVASTVVNAGLVGPAVRRLGERTCIAIGLGCGALGFAMYGLAPTGGLFTLGIPLVALWGIAGSSMTAVMSRHAGSERQGQLQGALGSLRGLVGIGAPVLYTQLFAVAVAHGGPTISGAPYVLGSLLLGVAAIVGWRAAR
jgi:DHA1 family tetracycline resistance protein-like MFS transporter